MRRTLAIALSAAGALTCLATFFAARAHASTCPVPPVLLAHVAAFGIAGLLDAFADLRRPQARRGWWMPWLLCGALGAASIIGVWSIAPGTLLAALAFALAGLARGAGGRPRAALAALTILSSSGLANFLVLFESARKDSIEVVSVPAGTFAERAFPKMDYRDAYRARIPSGAPHDLDSVTLAWLGGVSPCWARSPRGVQRVMRALRDIRHVSPSGPVFGRSEREILFGANEPHLDFRVSILLSEERGERWFTVSTLVRFNNWMGVAYFLPVRVGHQIILPQSLRNAAAILKSGRLS